MPQHIDYDKENERRVWWLNKTGGSAAEGLTVRDYFAAQALRGFIKDEMLQPSYADIASACYELADAFMKERLK